MKCVKCRGEIADNPKKCPLCNMNYNPSPSNFFEIQGKSIVKFVATSPICIINHTFDNLNPSAFENCAKVKFVVVPDTIKGIGEKSFANCKSLQSFTTPPKVKKIEKFTFCGCSSLESLTISESVVEIEDYAFSSCGSLTQLKIPSSVKKISKLAFAVPPDPQGLNKFFKEMNKKLSCTVCIPKHLSDTNFVDAESITFNIY